MAKSRFSNFLARINNRPLARTERFECTFVFPRTFQSTINEIKKKIGNGPQRAGLAWNDNAADEASIMCEEVQIPGMVLQNKEVPIGAWNYMRNSNVNFLGNEINITFLSDDDWFLRHVFEAWIDHCVDSTSKQVAYPDDQFGEVEIRALDIMDRVKTTWHLYEVTPKVLNLVPLGAMNIGIARTTLIISSPFWTSQAIDAHGQTHKETDDDEADVEFRGRRPTA